MHTRRVLTCNETHGGRAPCSQPPSRAVRPRPVVGTDMRWLVIKRQITPKERRPVHAGSRVTCISRAVVVWWKMWETLIIHPRSQQKAASRYSKPSPPPKGSLSQSVVRAGPCFPRPRVWSATRPARRRVPPAPGAGSPNPQKEPASENRPEDRGRRRQGRAPRGRWEWPRCPVANKIAGSLAGARQAQARSSSILSSHPPDDDARVRSRRRALLEQRACCRPRQPGRGDAAVEAPAGGVEPGAVARSRYRSRCRRGGAGECFWEAKTLDGPTAANDGGGGP